MITEAKYADQIRPDGILNHLLLRQSGAAAGGRDLRRRPVRKEEPAMSNAEFETLNFWLCGVLPILFMVASWWIGRRHRSSGESVEPKGGDSLF